MSILSERVKFALDALISVFAFWFIVSVGGFIIHNHVTYLALYDGVSVQLGAGHYVGFSLWLLIFPKTLWDANKRWHRLKEQNKNRF